MRFLPFVLLTFALGCASEPSTDSVDASVAADTVAAPPTPVGDRVIVTDAFARAAPAGGNSALYATLTNATPRADTLVAVETSAAPRTELHETVDVGDGMRGMRPLTAGVALPEGGAVGLAPGGMHVMLLDLKNDLTVGDTLAATFVLASGRQVEAPIAVQ